MRLIPLINNIFIKIIYLYKKIISPHLPNSCRFTPSCSTYAIEALQKHGTVKGLFFSIKRILKCHPFNSGGEDPVP